MQVGADGRRQVSGGDLEELLAAALQGTVPVAEDEDPRGGIRGTVRHAERLHLDVPRSGDPLLGEEPVVAESRAGLGTGTVPRVRHLRRVVDDDDAASATTGHRLEGDGPTGLTEEGFGLLRSGQDAGGRCGGDARPGGEVAGAVLVTEGLHRGGVRADEHRPGITDGADEGGGFGEEAVAGVHQVHPVIADDGHQGVDVEVGGGAGGGQLHGDVRQSGVQALPVVGGGHGDGAHSQVTGGAQDADGDLAAVGDEQCRTVGGGAVAHASSPASSWARRSTLRILPVAVTGIASTTTISGTL